MTTLTEADVEQTDPQNPAHVSISHSAMRTFLYYATIYETTVGEALP